MPWSVPVCPLSHWPFAFGTTPVTWKTLCEYLLRSRMNCGPMSVSSWGAGHRHSLKCDVHLRHVQRLARVKTSPFERFQCMENRLEPEGSKLVLNVSLHIPRSGYLRGGCVSQGAPCVQSPGPDCRCPVLQSVLQAEPFLGNRPPCGSVTPLLVLSLGFCSPFFFWPHLYRQERPLISPT